eukprot:jgi/Botrbrau1/13753/Bobra.0056s0010.1
MIDGHVGLTLNPDELTFIGVRLHQTYVQTVTVTNNLGATVEATIRAGAPDRYTVFPASLALKPGKSIDIDVKLRILKFAQKKKASEQGVRDIFHIKAQYFDQKFYSTFFLAPGEAAPGGGDARQPEPHRRSLSNGEGQPNATSEPAPKPRQTWISRPPSSVPGGLPHPSRGGKSAKHLMMAEKNGLQAEKNPFITERELFQPEKCTPEKHIWQPEGTLFPPERSLEGQAGARCLPAAEARRGDHPEGGRGDRLEGGRAEYGADSSVCLSLSHAEVPLPRPSFGGAPSGQRRLEPQGHESSLVVSQQQRLDQEAAAWDETRDALQRQEMLLREKENQIAALKARLQSSSRHAGSQQGPPRLGAPGDPGTRDLRGQLEHLEAALAEAEGANTALRARNRELAAELSGAKAEVAALAGLQRQLQAASPDLDAMVAAALARERALQDARNAKVLELLATKDEVISRYETEYVEVAAERNRALEALEDAQRAAAAAQDRVGELLETRAGLRRQAERAVADGVSSQASLQAEIALLREELAKAYAGGRRVPKLQESNRQSSRPALLQTGHWPHPR